MGFLKRNILFVDDDPGTRLLLQAMLEQAGYLPVTAPDGFEALDLVHKHAFDLILLDIMMPQMSGFDFLKRVRRDDRTRQVPVVMLSAKDDAKSIKKAMELGAVDYVVKPPQRDVVLKKIETILGSRPRFAEVPFTDPNDTDALVEISHTAHIISVGESGLVIRSPLPIERMSEQKLVMPFFDKLGIREPKLHLVSCSEEKAGSYINYFNYFGMTDDEVQTIRDWVLKKKLR
jgi:DNA-binding response OmpR family regulator